MVKGFSLHVAALVFTLPAICGAVPVVRSAGGSNDTASIQAAVDAFRADLGPLNPNQPGSFPTGRREINWDGVPDASSATNNLPADFFNGPTAPRARGAVFETPGTGFQVSADSSNPDSTPVEFGNINPNYPNVFRTFSPERLFISLNSNITDVLFFVPGTDTPATVSGFGSVFTSVDLSDSTSIEFFKRNGGSLGKFSVPAGTGAESLSFLGVSFTQERVAKVRITTGNAALGPSTNDGGGVDVAAMDDFIYSEPQECATIADVKAKVRQLDLKNRGLTRSLIVKLNSAKRFINRHDADKAIHHLDVFIHHVEVMGHPGHISQEDADSLISCVQSVIFLLDNQ